MIVPRILLAVLILALTPLFGVARLPLVALVVVVAAATERLIVHRQLDELRNALGVAERGQQMPERFGALAAWGELRGRADVPPPPRLRPDQHWEAVDTGGAIRQWTLVTDRPPLQTRIRARVSAVLRPYWTDVLVWLALHEPTFWTERDLPERPDSLHQARHRAPEEDQPPAEETEPVNEPDWRVSTGEIDLGITAILEASIIYAGVARGAR